ncbi:hypothetical protein NKI95_16185, partial [Mesorhizobium sp. M0306]|uniref:hypothetical protein n=1 Tax=Mesorhizobium sp. M0306 TaxID=2956932 RepID=UPI003334CC3B
NRRYNTFAKIIGKRSGHPMLASTPASILSHKTDKSGIPFDSVKGGTALAVKAVCGSANEPSIQPTACRGCT